MPAERMGDQHPPVGINRPVRLLRSGSVVAAVGVAPDPALRFKDVLPMAQVQGEPAQPCMAMTCFMGSPGQRPGCCSFPPANPAAHQTKPRCPLGNGRGSDGDGQQAPLLQLLLAVEGCLITAHDQWQNRSVTVVAPSQPRPGGRARSGRVGSVARPSADAARSIATPAGPLRPEVAPGPWCSGTPHCSAVVVLRVGRRRPGMLLHCRRLCRRCR